MTQKKNINCFPIYDMGSLIGISGTMNSQKRAKAGICFKNLQLCHKFKNYGKIFKNIKLRGQKTSQIWFPSKVSGFLRKEFWIIQSNTFLNFYILIIIKMRSKIFVKSFSKRAKNLLNLEEDAFNSRHFSAGGKESQVWGTPQKNICQLSCPNPNV